MGVKRKMASGTVFGTAIYIKDVEKGNRRHSMFICQCGNEFLARTSHVVNGETKGCGCQLGKNLIEQAKIKHPRLTHGYANSKGRKSEYNIWGSMIQRCTNPKNKTYARYGGRGITVCESWKHFENFINDMGSRPSENHSIERKDNDGNYEPSNCIWVLPDSQRANRSDNKLIEYHGITKPAFLWARDIGIPSNVIRARIKRGWSLDRTFNTPLLQ